jgi:hypothetical protein
MRARNALRKCLQTKLAITKRDESLYLAIEVKYLLLIYTVFEGPIRTKQRTLNVSVGEANR